MNPLPWYFAGPLIGLMVPLLLILREKQLGLSSSYRYLGSFVLPKNSYFKYDRSIDAWQVQFAIGIICASLIVFQLDLIQLTPVDAEKSYVHNFQEVYDLNYWFLFLFGGILVGFGSRYAGGCTAGHCIMGNSLLAPASILSTIMFFVGGLIVSHFVLPYIF